MLIWDGCILERKNRYTLKKSFHSTSKKSADFIQFVFTSLNYRAVINEDRRDKYKDGVCYNVYISETHNKVGISKDDRSKNTTKFNEVNSEDGLMYCFTVPKGYFVVRQNGKIYVSGNSGKGFISDKLIGTSDYKVFNVDDLKTMAQKSDLIVKNIKSGKYGDEYKGINISKLDLSDKTGKNTQLLHKILKDANIEGKQKEVFKQSIQGGKSNLKPNIMFDVTLQDMGRFNKIMSYIKDLGYEAENVNIVWVLNKLNIAISQNAKRDRFVPEDILIATHKGASNTMKEIMSMGDDLKKVGLNGDIWIAFNAKDIDSELEFHDDETKKRKKKIDGDKLHYLKDALLLKIKEKGKLVKSPEKAAQEIVDKIIANSKGLDKDKVKTLNRYKDVKDKLDKYPELDID